MQYKSTTKIIIDKRKLDLLTRLNCPCDVILQMITTGKFNKTGDPLIDDTLECLCDFKDFNNWGGRRDGSGRKPKNQDENQVDCHLGNQDTNQVVDKDKDRDKDYTNTTTNTINNIYNNKSKVVINSKFSVNKVPDLKIYVDEMPEDVIHSVEEWLIKKKLGQSVDISFISRQFMNFAKRMGRPVYKEMDK